MSFVSVKINNCKERIIKIYKPGLKIGTGVIIQSKEDIYLNQNL